MKNLVIILAIFTLSAAAFAAKSDDLLLSLPGNKNAIVAEATGTPSTVASPTLTPGASTPTSLKSIHKNRVPRPTISKKITQSDYLNSKKFLKD